jgi:hypothetical protein
MGVWDIPIVFGMNNEQLQPFADARHVCHPLRRIPLINEQVKKPLMESRDPSHWAENGH